ncbi:ABC transporter substrate-binding protein [Metabacillus arenae]|uniref:ABC transporter substrate-binding protein n=1 Tax=Metabacillus arenae TaxID=2771434 RepID=A0A926NEV3_9BACI|nr:ABC transporter substrate-binding protein [Metabacillus arenae]MBD1378713.1 ABC transporter substrate-binding protein [Metabacillus arenae]
MKKYLLTLLSVFLTLGLMAGCNSSAEKNNEQKPAQSNEQTNTQEEGSNPFPVTIQDGVDEKVVIEKEPTKIVSLIPSNTEVAFALGLGEKIVGVSDFDNYPEEVSKKEKIGGMDFNVEKILSLKPELVLAHASGAHNSAEGLQQLRDAGISVLVVNDAQNLDQVYESITMIGKASGTEEKAEEMISEMKTKFENIQKTASEIPEDKQKSVFLEVQPAPEIYTAGKNTFMNELLTLVGAKNAAADQEGWVKITEEAIIELNPDVIVTTYGYYSENPVEQIKSREGWDSVTAVRDGQIYDIHSDLVSRTGPRLVEGVEQLAKAIYPDYFKE